MVEPHPEAPRPLLEIPSHVIDAIDSQQFPATAREVHRDNDSSTRRLFKSVDHLPGAGPVTLAVDYKKYFEVWPNDFDMIDVQYSTDDGLVGTMQFAMMPDGTFDLKHRYIEPSLRNNNIGERLLAQAETIFRGLARKRQANVTIGLQLGQRNVLRWFKRQAYQPVVDDKLNSATVAQEVIDHPEHFLFEPVLDKRDQILKEDGIFRPETKGRTLEDTVRINLDKTFSPEA